MAASSSFGGFMSIRDRVYAETRKRVPDTCPAVQAEFDATMDYLRGLHGVMPEGSMEALSQHIHRLKSASDAATKSLRSGWVDHVTEIVKQVADKINEAANVQQKSSQRFDGEFGEVVP